MAGQICRPKAPKSQVHLLEGQARCVAEKTTIGPGEDAIMRLLQSKMKGYHQFTRWSLCN